MWNVAKNVKSAEAWKIYAKALNEYKKETRQAKRMSWREFCESVMETQEAARMKKIISRDPTVPGCLKKPDGSWTETNGETLNTLLSTHFPGCTNVDVNSTTVAPRVISLVDRAKAREIVSKEKIEWAIDSFKPYKAAGTDGVMPAMLQNSRRSILPLLVGIYRSCLLAKYLPRKWREVRVVFIPKTGKTGHNSPKDYRPISLSSFLLKTMERLIEIYIKGIPSFGSLCSAQHDYCKGKSVDTALHEAVKHVEASLRQKEFTLAAFIDIEGAFNNLKTTSIMRALEVFGVDEMVTDWIVNMLRSRIINSTWGNTSRRKCVDRGTPQGGVLSPLLWNLAVDEILKDLTKRRIKAVAYADDMAILVSGKFPSTLSELMESALKVVSKWAESNGLAVNATKTELILFTGKRRAVEFNLPKIGSTTLQLSKEARYLGVILDSKLNWKANTEYRTKKALIAFNMCRRTFGKRWGMRPYIVYWMYTAIILPILTYGCLVWWNSVNVKTQLRSFDKVQRLACIGITGALRTTPTAGMRMILHMLSMELYVKCRAAKSAVRLKSLQAWENISYGHASIFDQFPGVSVPEQTDYLTGYLDFGSRYKILIPQRGSWESNSVMRNEISIFTDGSKMSQGVGAGVFSELSESFS